MPVLDSAVSPASPDFEKKRGAFDKALATFRERLALVAEGGGQKARERHLSRDKILARDRIDLLLDPGAAFLELSPLAAYGLYDNQVPAAAIITGVGIVEGVPCMIIANDPTVKGGTFYSETVKKHYRAQEIADALRLPVIYLVDCGGANLSQQDLVFPDKEHFGGTFWQQSRMSAKGIPQLSVVFGPATAGGAYIPALSDEVVMVKGHGHIFLGGPPLVKAATKEEVDADSLGGAELHTFETGVSDHIAYDEREALGKMRDIVRSLNSQKKLVTRDTRPPRLDPDEIAGIIGDDLKVPFDIREVIGRLVDDSDFQQFKPDYGSSLVCGFAKLHGHPVAILANNGVLFADSAVKGAHFIELADQRQIPLLFLQNITGFMIGLESERAGIAKHSSKLVYAVSNARVPKLTVVVGGSYGAGNYGMCGRGFRPDFLFTWPNSRTAVMGGETAAGVLTDLQRGRVSDDELKKIEQGILDQFEEQSSPYYSTARLWDDGIIEPGQTRDVLGFCLGLVADFEKDTGPRPVYRM
ncbi:carboxyl transferase domain-containing protein [Aquisalinus flavus]|uniref:Methylcrotonoyl-CoA carboxylase n=1 Tax=Aquisalinus flavus TaxID=1526572 RepID=A0A8J2V3W9_9PROT|nr:carboxyl transferase domain-containing protein [Aquisalinus flavus]MBD0427002.1 methylcrotonoyl-CoA carboxylase [Aquisalinus flavus]UNE46832.1 methylcrotonoyl-CoA carboxylase [Aquisalinus flavus]GGC97585.1 methylcrotonoyl-CoA carboxylase [Aquisalinus flavus]